MYVVLCDAFGERQAEATTIKNRNDDDIIPREDDFALMKGGGELSPTPDDLNGTPASPNDNHDPLPNANSNTTEEQATVASSLEASKNLSTESKKKTPRA